jgi:hypothetical protein
LGEYETRAGETEHEKCRQNKTLHYYLRLRGQLTNRQPRTSLQDGAAEAVKKLWLISGFDAVLPG